MGASGTTTLSFGAFPGAPEVTVDVTGQTGFVATSEVDAWIQPIATGDHSVDEHLVESIKVTGYYQADGTIRIWGRFDGPVQLRAVENNRLFGQFTVGWAWN